MSTVNSWTVPLDISEENIFSQKKGANLKKYLSDITTLQRKNINIGFVFSKKMATRGQARIRWSAFGKIDQNMVKNLANFEPKNSGLDG
jgi:hypothetical protein